MGPLSQVMSMIPGIGANLIPKGQVRRGGERELEEKKREKRSLLSVLLVGEGGCEKDTEVYDDDG